MPSEETPGRALRQRKGGPQASTSEDAATSVPTPSKGQKSHSDARRGSIPGFYSHTYAVHTQIRSSPFDKNAPGGGEFRGFLNLAMLLLVVTNLRLVIENAQKYGLSTWSGSLDISGRDWTLAALCLALMPLHLAISVLVERRAALTPFTEAEESATIRLHIANLVFQISIPTVIVYFFVKHPLPGMVALFLPTILFLKLISYVLVNKELRRERDDKLRRDQGIDVLKSPRPAEDPAKDALDHALLDPDAPPFDPAAVKYPDNLTLGNIGYFWLAPTLCYQPCYPRITRFRKSYFAKRVLEMVIVSIGIVFLAGQYALPTLKNSTTAMKEVSVGRILERLLKLSVTSLYIWILGFYLFFHSFLSAFAEVLQFGDRRFFGEWWNSTSLAEYWRLWNSPVSSWAKRHIYLPLIRNHSISPAASQLIVFLVSAALHELIIGVPTHSLYGFAFVGMMLQVPLIWADALLVRVRQYLGWKPRKEVIDTIGNLNFWFNFCIVGQPFILMLYYYDWQRKNAQI